MAWDQKTCDDVRNAFTILGQLSIDQRLNQTERDAISFVAGLIGGAPDLPEDVSKEWEKAFFEGQRQ